MAYNSVMVSVEVPIENQIQEITFDGQEIYQTPLTLSENLSMLAQKIDFSRDDADEVSEPEPMEEDGVKKETTFQAATWPWESIRSRLRNAYTEISVLHDILSIAKDKRYLVLDPVQQDPPDPKPVVQLISKKKSLSGAAQVLVNGAERLRCSQSESVRNSRLVPDFHIELLRLRQNWRLKKVANTILGDLSYRTAGSHYWQSGVFEVSKSEENGSGTEPSPPPSPATPQKPASALKVTVPSELEGIAYIQVLIQKDQETLVSSSVSLPGPVPPGSPPDTHWQQRLEAAQNVLFCKELFAQLAREAVALKAPIPHLVVGNQITASLFPGIQLLIGLCHSGGGVDRKGHSGASPPLKMDHNHVLEHSLHQLLREVHHMNLPSTLPHPSTSPLGIPKRRRLAGPNAYDFQDLVNMTMSETLLEQIIKQAQHVVLRLRTMYVIDTLSKEIRDPLIVSHWNGLTSPTQSCVKINILTHGYDYVWRTSLVIHVSERTLKCVCRDGRVMHMSYEPQELRDLILCQISQHQVTAVQCLAKYMGWHVLASSPHLGLGQLESLGNASSCLLASPTGDRLIALRSSSSPQTGMSVSVAHAPRKDFFPGQLVKDRKWENLAGPFRDVRWDRMEGRNFLNKMELLMASLTTG